MTQLLSHLPDGYALTEHMSRRPCLPDDLHHWHGVQSCRLRFMDREAGHVLWKLTSGLHVNRIQYYDIPVWNVDGSRSLFLSTRPGHRCLHDYSAFMGNGHGENWRPLERSHLNRQLLAPLVWSNVDPDVLYGAEHDGRWTFVFRRNVADGTQNDLAQLEGTDIQVVPPAPEDRRLIARRFGESRFFLIDLATGTTEEVNVSNPVSRIRFTKRADDAVYYNVIDQEPAFVVDVQGKVIAEVPRGTHPDWSPDGRFLTFIQDGALCRFDMDAGQTVRVLGDVGDGLHGGWSRQGDMICHETRTGKKYEWLGVTDPETRQMVTLCCSGWGPAAQDHHYGETTHPNPQFSPDGGNVIFHSDMLGPFSDVYVAVYRRPPAPQASLRKRGRGFVVHVPPGEDLRYVSSLRVYGFDGQRTAVAYPCGPQGCRAPAPLEGDVAVSVVGNFGLESDLTWLRGESKPRPPVPRKVRNPRTHAGGMASILVEWDEAENGLALHYNVYASERKEFSCDHNTIVGSPAEPRFFDVGIPHDGLRYSPPKRFYRVTAVNGWGQESTPSDVVRGEAGLPNIFRDWE